VQVLHHHHPDGPRIDVEVGDTPEQIVDAAVRIHAVMPSAVGSGVRYRLKLPGKQSADYYDSEKISELVAEVNRTQTKEVTQ
jgi:hypothetical protein